MLLSLALTLTILALVVLLLGSCGYWTPDTLRHMKISLAHLGTRVTALFRRLSATTDEAPCACLACHHFVGVDLSVRSKHKLLPRLAGEAAEGLAAEIEEFLGAAT
jgi:cytochrome c553